MVRAWPPRSVQEFLEESRNRAIIHNERPQISWLVDGFAKRSGISVHCDISDGMGRLSRNCELALFRVLHECLTNIHRYSQACLLYTSGCKNNGCPLCGVAKVIFVVRIEGLEATEQVAIVTGVSALLSGFEAFYSHYKNNFRYAAQWTPIILAPALAAAAFRCV